MTETVFEGDVKTVSIGAVANDVVRASGQRSGRALINGGMWLDVKKMRLACISYGLEDVGRASALFSEIGETGRMPDVGDAVRLKDFPRARACFIEFCDAIASVDEVPHGG